MGRCKLEALFGASSADYRRLVPKLFAHGSEHDQTGDR